MSALHPPLTMVLKSTGLNVQQFIECTRCLEASHDESSVQEWAENHSKERQGHTLFRTVSQATWFLVPRKNSE
ncbi:hypothetical protein ABZ445_16390 [Streptomyces chartreusis]|uniref:DUF7848 domain-containing protein n=1 Tax=Streptomyces chartreusis TaxID=1969 RepID=UPI0033E31940